MLLCLIATLMQSANNELMHLIFRLLAAVVASLFVLAYKLQNILIITSDSQQHLLTLRLNFTQVKGFVQQEHTNTKGFKASCATP